MQRLAWLTDVHLDCASASAFGHLVREVNQCRPDAVLLGGDIAQAPSFLSFLNEMADRFAVPLYFVLGNHDYYRGSITAVRRDAHALSDRSDVLTWLPEAGVVSLSERTVLVGHGGWGDARYGNFLKSDVLLNDYLLIEELRRATYGADNPQIANLRFPPLPDELLEQLNALGDEAADYFRTVLPQALEVADDVIVLTHVPPFREACWHEGKLSDDNWLPHFACQAVGDVLREFMQQHPHKKMTVLCGHTHGAGIAQVLPNLEVLTGGAIYGQPCVERVLEVG